VRFVLGGDQVAHMTGERIPGPSAAGQHGAVRPQADAGPQHQFGQQSARQPGTYGPWLHKRSPGYLVMGQQVQVIGKPPGAAQPAAHRAIAWLRRRSRERLHSGIATAPGRHWRSSTGLAVRR